MRITVESTALATVVYDETRELLQLEFCNWAVGLYVEVAAAVHPSTSRPAFEDQVQAIRRP